MKIVQTGDDEFRLSAAPAEARILINCMKETFREGRAEGIPLREYFTRVGATLDEVKAIISAIEGALAR
jgi:hypothetical protein